MPVPTPFDALLKEATSTLKEVSTAAQLEQWRVDYLGRKGRLTTATRQVLAVPAVERPVYGAAANQAKQRLEQLFDEYWSTFNRPRIAETVDITLPGTNYRRGHRHPLSLVQQELEEIFSSLGFSIAEGPEVEDDWHNFEALNLGPDHPGRDMWDTFYVKGSRDAQGRYRMLPRTHTSSVQIRAMEQASPPLKILVPGRVYRNEAEDATHGAIFQNVEGLMVDQTTSFADLKGILTLIVHQLLGEQTKLRFRPSFFPFTEPSAEIDISSPEVRGGAWLELAGAGMVHPNVLRNVGYDAERYRGFAFGLGADRIAMLKYGMQDLRQLYRPDVRILEQF